MLTELIHQKGCNKTSIITDTVTGEIACSNCGTILPEKAIEQGLENSSSIEGYSSSRVGSKISLKIPDMGLSTIIEAQDKDFTGKPLSKENSRIFYRLRLWDRNSRSANTVKSFQKAFILLDSIGTKLGLPESVIEETAHLFRKISAKKILSGRSTVVVLCATTYMICRLTDTPRTLHDIADVANVKTKHLQRIYRFLAKELNVYPEAYSPNEFVTRLAKAIDLSEKTQKLTFKILDIAGKKGISTSKNPMSMAAAAIHLACLKNSEKISQLKIAQISGISAVTIRDRVNEMRKTMSEI